MMNRRLEKLREKVINGYYARYRRLEDIIIQDEYDCSHLDWAQQVTLLLQGVIDKEQAVIEEDERIVLTRTTLHPVNPIPAWIKNEGNRPQIGYRVHNICADWHMVLWDGLQGRRETALRTQSQISNNSSQYHYLDSVLESLDTVEKLVRKYQEKAREMGLSEIETALQCIIKGKPDSFYHALQSLRFLQGVLWMNGHNHIGFGRFDQYMWPYLERDIKNRRISYEQAEELLAEFLIAVNKDTDVYPGIQKGDNGQSLMLGGITKTGESGLNPLTAMVLKVALELCLPEPKINLRIDQTTPKEIVLLAADLIQKGLGFPQFCNDEVVIPSLVNNGYNLEDARDYVVAACWEFIIPGKGMDVPNINALSFPAEVDAAIRKGFMNNTSFDEILQMVHENICDRVEQYVNHKKDIVYWPPAPLFTAFMTECLDKGLDINNGGAKYCNYGIHGSGSAHAADALAAVKYVVFERQLVTSETYLDALIHDWNGYESLLEVVLAEAPKVGNNDERADGYLVYLFNSFYEACLLQEGVLTKGDKRIRIRAGTGTAMYYLWLVKVIRPNQLESVIKASADGRKEGDYFSANLSPSLGIKTAGPISCLQSFSKINYWNICNGGPITMELLPSCFQNETGREQIVNLLKAFLFLNCQQLQLNMVSSEQLIEAKYHPKKYKNLIVRVWGWSAYFIDLDEEFQNHIINRTYYSTL